MLTRDHFPATAMSALLLLIAGTGGTAVTNTHIPSRATADAVMASPAEMQEVLSWARETFSASPSASEGRVELRVLRQDHNTLRFRESCMETPIRIGKESFARGLGTHANSEIAAKIPTGATAFEATVGGDNNYDTQGVHGTVRFIIEAGGTELLRTDTCRGGDEPLPVSVDLPAGATELTLKADATEDGAAFDQADWADARFVMADGSVRWLDDGRTNALIASASPPFSFVYGGRPSSEFLGEWKQTCRQTVSADCTAFDSEWTDPETGLAVKAEAKVFKDYPAVEWLLLFENRGDRDTPIIESVQAADLQLATGLTKHPLVLHQLHGDSCDRQTFQPYDTSLEAGRSITMAPSRGRPSQETAFPFWNLQYADKGIITAVGWSGQWSASYDRSPTGPTTFRMGMEKTHMLLHPGEKIRTPRVLLMPWTGDRQAAHNRFRRLMLFHYVPQQNGRPLRLPIALQTFDRYHVIEEWKTEAAQLAAVEMAHRLGCDTYWFDAGWFPGGFPQGAGNWYAKPKEFPNGLRPVSDLAHRYGMQFVLWFEPCRVAPGTQIAVEHPEFVLGGGKDGLFNLGDPAARRWITDLISSRIAEYGVDVYREDYNIDPLDFWRENDPPDRQGMTEIRFVEGHYAFWDELRRRHPGLWIDNCASGGRRIDLETCMRSVPLWRSDTNCWAGHPEWNQMQSVALSQYVPLHTACGWHPERYVLRSSATGGALCQFDYRNADFRVDEARDVIAEARENRKYWYGDIYPLTQIGAGLGDFTIFQLHRPDLDEGMVLAFRRDECSYKGIILELQTLDPKAAYEVERVDERGESTSYTATGRQLVEDGLEVRIPGKAESLLIRYRRADSPR